jgi:serralysin
MKSRSATDLQDPSFFSAPGDGGYPNYWLSSGEDGATPVADARIGAVANTSSSVTTTVANTSGTLVVVNSGGITFDLLFDATAPASFKAGIEQAASMLSAAIFDKITVNLNIHYSGTGGGAFAGPDNGFFESYSTVRSDLINNATAGDTTFNALPGGTERVNDFCI